MGMRLLEIQYISCCVAWEPQEQKVVLLRQQIERSGFSLFPLSRRGKVSFEILKAAWLLKNAPAPRLEWTEVEVFLGCLRTLVDSRENSF